jgi:hypothetical protein
MKRCSLANARTLKGEQTIMRINSRVFVHWLTLVTILVCLVGCIAPTATAPSATPAQSSASDAEASDAVSETASLEAPTLTEEQLANAPYPVDLTPSGIIPLENGEYSEPIVEGSASELVVTMGQVAYGDLNGDGVDDAAVILIADSGGTGTYSYLSPVLNQEGEPEPAPAALLGDRVEVQSLAIAEEEIWVEMVTHGPQDPMCCPTLVVTNSYQLQENQLVLTSTTAPE